MTEQEAIEVARDRAIRNGVPWEVHRVANTSVGFRVLDECDGQPVTRDTNTVWKVVWPTSAIPAENRRFG